MIDEKKRTGNQEGLVYFDLHCEHIGTEVEFVESVPI